MAAAFAVLNWITIIYGVVLALVLTVTLITIAVCLIRTATALKTIAGGLKTVEDQTAPLGGHLEQLNAGLGAVSDGLTGAAGHLVATDQLLAGVVPDAATGKAA